MGRVRFEVSLQWALDADRVFDAMVDWPSHSEWVPATTVWIRSGDGGVGTEFTARTGLGALGLDDRMTVTALDRTSRRCTVEKTGPWLGGSAGFEVHPTPEGCRVVWLEDVEVPGLPGFLTGIAARFGRIGFRGALEGLRRQLSRTPTGR